jgi:hypothetical protein
VSFTPQFVRLMFIYFAAAACTSAQAQSVVPTSADIVAQMAQAQTENRDNVRPYVLMRSYQLFGQESVLESKSRVIAEITVVPPDSKKYIIESADGSGWGEKIVRKMLDGEVAFAKDSGSTAITGQNYDFRLIREDELNGRRCYVLDLLPKRKSKDLLRGTIWVDANTYLPRRVEGEPAEGPSWWMRDVRVVLVYGYVGTMWLQTSSEATANVRILGRSTMVWHDVRYQIGEFAPGAAVESTMVSVDETTTEDQR